MIAMRSARPLPRLLLALALLAIATPSVALTCVPWATCGTMRPAHETLAGAQSSETIAAPDCCQRQVRDEERPATAAPAASFEAPAAVAVPALLPLPAKTTWQAATVGPRRAPDIPLYALHSILLI